MLKTLRDRSKAVAQVILCACAYYLFAVLGLQASTEAVGISPIWPAAGIALALVTVLGPRAYLGVALGCFVSNYLQGVPPLSAFGVMVSALIEVFLAFKFVKPILSRRLLFTKLTYMVRFLFFSCTLATGLGSFIGVLSMYLGGIGKASDFFFLWTTWWVGDFTGVLIFSPVALYLLSKNVFARSPHFSSLLQKVEYVVLFAGLIWVNHHVFSGTFFTGSPYFPVTVTSLPFIVWACLRFRSEDSLLAILVSTSLAFWGTFHGHGPFGPNEPQVRLFLLQTFVAVISITGMVMAASIGERAQIERSLKKSKNRFHRAVSGSLDGLFEWSLDGKYAWCSPRFLEGLGYTDQWGPSFYKNWMRTLHPHDLKKTITTIRANLHHRRTFECEFRMKDCAGEYRWYRTRALVFKGSAYFPKTLSGSIRDITKERQEEEAREAMSQAILESEKNLRNMANSLPILLALVNDELELEFTNDQYKMWFGAQREHGPPEKLELSLGLLAYKKAKTLLSKFSGDSISFESEAIHKDGSHRLIQLTFLPRFSLGKSNSGYYILGVDVTDQRMLEKYLREAKNNAEHASQAKSNFLANMSHEIRTPLTAIIGFSQILAEGTCSAEQQKQFILRVQKSASHLKALINDLLDLSKIEANRAELELSEFNFRSTIEKHLDVLTGQAECKGLKLHHHVSKEVPALIYSDATKLGQILHNIVGNAIKFTDQGSVSVTFSLLPSALGEMQKIQCLVQDTGCGLDKTQIEKLFKPFSQADSSITRKFGGTGLGLILSKKLCEMLNGDIEILSSEPQVGTTFAFTFAISSQKRKLLHSSKKKVAPLPSSGRFSGQWSSSDSAPPAVF